MAIATRTREQKRWINTSIAFISIITGIVFIMLIDQLNTWFEIEALLPFNFKILSQGTGVLVGLSTFIAILKYPSSSTYVEEIFQEVIKVVWPEKNQTVRMTVGIIIGIVIVGCLLGLFDVISSRILSYIH
jgi:preprotein translocase subunit SecE